MGLKVPEHRCWAISCKCSKGNKTEEEFINFKNSRLYEREEEN